MDDGRKFIRKVMKGKVNGIEVSDALLMVGTIVFNILQVVHR